MVILIISLIALIIIAARHKSMHDDDLIKVVESKMCKGCVSSVSGNKCCTFRYCGSFKEEYLNKK